MLKPSLLQKVAATALLTLLTLTTATGCTPNKPTEPKQVAEKNINKDGTTTDKDGVEAVSPQIIIMDENMDGQTVHVEPKTNVVLASTSPGEWTGTSSDEAIAKFVPGQEKEDYTTNPSLQIHRDGTTEITVTKGDKDYTFTVISVYKETEDLPEEQVDKPVEETSENEDSSPEE